MDINDLASDDAVLTELGERLTRRRLDLQLTQADVAEQAGIGKRTLERMEAGHSAQLSSFIRVLRALDALPGLDRLIPQAQARPMELLKGKGKTRQRASGSRAHSSQDEPWSWEDDA